MSQLLEMALRAWGGKWAGRGRPTGQQGVSDALRPQGEAAAGGAKSHVFVSPLGEAPLSPGGEGQ